jgi:hypothetical protein
MCHTFPYEVEFDVSPTARVADSRLSERRYNATGTRAQCAIGYAKRDGERCDPINI